MNQIQAMRDSWALIKERRLARDITALLPMECRTQHLGEMLAKVEAAEKAGTPFSPAKLGRWLGWMQCAATAVGYMSLEESKAINLANAADEGDEITIDVEKLKVFLSGLKLHHGMIAAIIKELATP